MKYNNQEPITVSDAKKAVMLIPPTLPRKVEAAMGFVHMLGDHGASQVPTDYPVPQKRKTMTDGEGRAYEAALAVIKLYFTGEMNFEDTATVIELSAPQVDR